MKIRFTKMHGLGNDFVVLDAVTRSFGPNFPNAAQVRFLADRHFGVGCDQLLVVEPATQSGVDFRYRIFNADGGEVEQCGNGARCFAQFVREKGLTAKSEIRVETQCGLIAPKIEADGTVTVDMGEPAFEPAQIPFIADSDQPVHALQLEGESIEISVVSMGNPHAVQWVTSADSAPVARQGPQIESHARFPQRVNAGFMQVVDRHAIQLRVYERGAGETLACGTGACAAAVAGIRRGLLDSPVRVTTLGGDLRIAWTPGTSVMMTGPAVTVFDAEIDIPDNLD